MTSVLDSVITPPEWKLVPFGRLVERRKAAGRPDLPPLSVFLDEGVVPRSSRKDNFNQLGSDLSKYLVVHPGDVVFNKLRTWQGGLGVSCYLGIVSPAYFVCAPSQGVVPQFLHYLLRSATYLAELTRISKFMPPSQFDILWDDLRLVPILIPKVSTQQAIADYLDTETARIDTLISKKRHLITLLTERKALSADNGLDRLRESETLVPLKYLVCESDVRCETNNELELLLVSIHRGVIPKRLGPNNQTASEDLSKYKVVSAGDIVVNRMRAFQGGLGVAPQPGIVSPDYTVLRVGSQVLPEFLHYLLRSSWFVSEMTRRLRGIGATDQGQVRTPRINFGDLGKIEVPVPPRTVQEEIAFNLSAREAQLTRLVDLQTKQLTLLREKRQATITAAATGEIAVQS